MEPARPGRRCRGIGAPPVRSSRYGRSGLRGWSPPGPPVHFVHVGRDPSGILPALPKREDKRAAVRLTLTFGEGADEAGECAVTSVRLLVLPQNTIPLGRQLDRGQSFRRRQFGSRLLCEGGGGAERQERGSNQEAREIERDPRCFRAADS
jgi:hypothetical protein